MIMKCIYVVIILLMTLFKNTVSFSAYYSYHPKSRLYLGGGFNPYFPHQGTSTCVEFDGIKSLNNNTANNSYFELSMIKSHTEFLDKTHFSAFLESSFVFLSGNLNIFMNHSNFSSLNELNWIILFKTDYGKFILENPRLKDEYKDLSPSSIMNKCGLEIVTEENKSVLIYALFSMKDLTKTQKKYLESKFKANYSSHFFNANIISNYKSFLDATKKIGHITLKIYALGGTGLIDMKDLIDDTQFVDHLKIPTILKKYMTNMTKENSVSSYFITSPIHIFLKEKKYFPSIKRKEIIALYHQYYDIFNRTKKLEAHINTNPEISSLQLNKYYTRLERWNDLLKDIEDTLALCFNPEEDKSCLVKKLNYKDLVLPFTENNNANFCEEKRVKALRNHLIKEDFYLMAVRRNFVPIIENNKITSWLPCEKSLNQ